jgi:hypothetical protein
MDKAETNPSIMMKHVEREEARKTSSPSPSPSPQPQEAAA